MRSSKFVYKISYRYTFNKMQNTVRLSHYKIFEFEEKMTNRFVCNNSYHYQDYSDASGDLENFVRIPANQVPKYELNLVNNELYLLVFEEGTGNYPAPHNYMQFRKRIYFEGQSRDLKRQVVFAQFANKQNSQPLELLLSISKCGFQGKAFVGCNFGQKIIGSIPPNKILVVQIQVLGISEFPLNDTFSEFSKFNNEIIRHALEGDAAFANRDLQETLFQYETAIQKILSQYYMTSLTKHKRTITKQERETLRMLTSRNKREEKDRQIDEMIKNKQIALEIEEFSEKIVLKGIEVALLAKQYFKVVKWARLLMVNPKYQCNIRLLIMRSKALSELDQIDKALIDLKSVVKLNSSYTQAKQQIQILEKRRSSMKSLPTAKTI